jgi:hypothetical protein
MMSLGVEMAPALREPLPECVDLHETSPILFTTFVTNASTNSCGLADVEHFTAFCNVRQQDIYEWMLAVESKTALIFGYCDALDRRQVSNAESVILGSEQTFPAVEGPPGINPIIHDVTAYERSHLLRAVPAVKQQSIAAVGAIVYGEPGEPRYSGAALVLPNVGSIRERISLNFCVIGHSL